MANGTLPAQGGGGMAEQWGDRWRLVCSCVKFGETEAEGCLICMKSDTRIRMVALKNVDSRAGPKQSRIGHPSSLYSVSIYSSAKVQKKIHFLKFYICIL